MMTHLEKPILHMDRVAFARQKHGIIIIGTWCYEKGRSQPCLVLLHAARPIMRGRTVPIIIRLETAYLWAAHAGIGNPEHCRAAADEWLQAGLLPTSGNAIRDAVNVLDAVNDNLRDLIHMPPAPKGEREILGDMLMVNKDTGEITEREMIQYV